MLYEPWPLEGGEYRSPDTEESRDRYAVSGTAVRETLQYFEECGGDTVRLVGLLNSHAVDGRYRTSRSDLLDDTRWYTNEYYFYFIMFTKKVIGRYDFRYGENDPDGANKPLSEHHRIYELGMMRRRPWGIDEDGREIRDVTMSNLIAARYSFSSDQKLLEDFIQFLNNCLPDDYSLDIAILEKQLLWCSLQFIEYSFELVKVLMSPEEQIAKSVFRSIHTKILITRMFRAVPHALWFGYFRSLFDSTNQIHKTTYHVIEDNQLTIEGRLIDNYEIYSQYDRYVLSGQKNDVAVWLGAVAGLVAIRNNSLSFPDYELRLSKDGYGFQIRFKLTPHEDRVKEIALTALVMACVMVPSLAASILFGQPVSGALMAVYIAIGSILTIRDRRSRREIRRVL